MTFRPTILALVGTVAAREIRKSWREKTHFGMHRNLEKERISDGLISTPAIPSEP